MNYKISDKSNWLDGHCVVPFKNLLIDENGTMYKCFCQSFLPVPLGNILDINTSDEFWHLHENNQIRDSILDKSHRFCDENLCSALQEKFYNTHHSRGFFESYEKVIDIKLETLQLVIDPSCNLQCPSCRKEMILLHGNLEFQTKLQNILTKLNDFFFNPLRIKEIFLLGNGEFLASKKITDWLLEKVENHPELKYTIQTNGTLIYNQKDRLENLFKKTKRLLISIDASTEEIYSKTRINGNWHNLIMGLEWLKQLNEETLYALPITFNYVVSSLNYHDIGNFIKFAENYPADTIYFSRIQQWEHLYFNEQWQMLDIFDTKHPSHKKFINVLRNIDFTNPLVQTNFHNFIHENIK